jgi:peptidoglycan hydrolase-like protein with peptidoglycan-binding domain
MILGYHSQTPNRDLDLCMRSPFMIDNAMRRITSQTLVPPAVSVRTNAAMQTLRRGARGAAVKTLQLLLNRFGAKPQIPLTGYFGDITWSAVVSFQQLNRIAPYDGIVGPKTWSVLEGKAGKISVDPTQSPRSTGALIEDGIRKSSKYFSDDEMRCKGSSCGCGNAVNIDPVFDQRLLELREAFGRPMKVTSVCRCLAHNTNVGGAKRSFHISDKPAWDGVSGTAAADVAFSDESYRNELGQLAWSLGWRIGLHTKFLHIDSGSHLGAVAQSVFLYDKVTTSVQLAAFKLIVTQNAIAATAK